MQSVAMSGRILSGTHRQRPRTPLRPSDYFFAGFRDVKTQESRSAVASTKARRVGTGDGDGGIDRHRPLQGYKERFARLGWVRGSLGNWCSFLGLGFLDGFVRYFVTEGFEAVEFLQGAAVHSLGLDLVAEQESDGIGALGLAKETFGQEVVAVLGGGEGNAAGEVGLEEEDGIAGGVDGLVDAAGEEAGFEVGEAEDGLLGEGHTLNGEEFLGAEGW
jgi:hypothetical protein